MKIIIAYASAGAGHAKAAEAVFNYFISRGENVDIKIVDVLDQCSLFFRLFYTRGYSFLINHALVLWALGFWITEQRKLCGLFQKFNLFIDRLSCRKFFAFLEKESPDYVISAHFLPSEITAYLKRTNKIKSKLVTVITDFGLHPFWLCAGTDIYAVALESTKSALKDQGVREEIIRVTGIPIGEVFAKKYDRAFTCRKLEIRDDQFSVLLVTGSFGIGPLLEITDLLQKEIQLLVVCARNVKLFSRLKDKQYPNVKVFGFVDNIQEMMAVSDLIITKPGGLSVAELLAMELVPVFISAIPGQEAGNARVLADNGVGEVALSAQEVKEIVLDYREHPDKIRMVKEKIKALKRPAAVQELYNVVCKSSLRAGDRRTA